MKKLTVEKDMRPEPLLEAWFLMSGEGLDLIDDHALESTWHDGYEIL